MRFEGLHDGILRLVKVFGRMFVGRLIATTDVTTDQAQPQVHPPAAGLQALLAAIGRSWADVLHVLEVGTANHYSGLSIAADTTARKLSTSNGPSWRTPLT